MTRWIGKRQASALLKLRRDKTPVALRTLDRLAGQAESAKGVMAAQLLRLIVAIHSVLRESSRIKVNQTNSCETASTAHCD
jgi:hypothetical protein